MKYWASKRNASDDNEDDEHRRNISAESRSWNKYTGQARGQHSSPLTEYTHKKTNNEIKH